jgi:hypothetical protein
MGKTYELLVPHIVKQLICGYLDIRFGEKRYGWEKIDLNNLPTSGPYYEKLQTITMITNAVPSYSVFFTSEWLDFLNTISEIEESERKKAIWPLPERISGWLSSEDLLLEATLCTIRTFIIQQIQLDDSAILRFNDHITFLDEEIAKKTDVKAFERFRKALVLKPKDANYHEKYFTETIQLRNPLKANDTPEKSFEDFCESVVDCKRVPKKLTDLIIQMARLTNPSSGLQQNSIFPSATNTAITDDGKINNQKTISQGTLSF